MTELTTRENRVWHTIRNILIWIPITFGIILVGGHTSTTPTTIESPADYISFGLIAPIILFAIPLFFMRLWNKNVPGKFAPEVWHIILVLSLIVPLMIYGTFKSNNTYFNWQDEKVTERFADVNIEYQQRFNVITNIAQATRSLADHERAIITDITNARTQYVNTNSVNGRVEAINNLDTTIRTLSINVENYPNITATAAYFELIDSIKSSEARLAEAKRVYNQEARLFNSYARTIPHLWYVSSIVEEPVKKYLDAVENSSIQDATRLLDNL